MRKKYHRETILETGAEVIRQQGYHNTGINDILKACGIPKGSFYNFFESKEDFGLQIIDYYGLQYQKMIADYLLDEGFTPLERLKNFYRYFIDMNLAEGFRQGCLMNNLCQETAGIYDRFGQHLDVQFERLIQVVSQCVRKGQHAGEIRDDYPPEELASFLHLHALGAQTRTKSSRTVKALDIFYRVSFDFLEKKN